MSLRSLLPPPPIAGGNLKASSPYPPHHFPLPLPDIPSDTKTKIISLEMLGVDAGRAIAANPAIRSASPDSIAAVVSYLHSKGFRPADLARILGMCPTILTSSVPGDLAPVVRFLSDQIGLDGASDLRRSVIKCPRLLASSPRDQLMPALVFLRRLGFQDDEALAFRYPILLVSSVEKTLKPKLGFLSAMLGLSRDEAAATVVRCPALFTSSIENNIKPKFDYFQREMEGEVEEIKEFPQFFTFSLEKRIKPRHQAAKLVGGKLRLPELLKTTDEEFERIITKGL